MYYGPYLEDVRQRAALLPTFVRVGVRCFENVCVEIQLMYHCIGLKCNCQGEESLRGNGDGLKDAPDVQDERTVWIMLAVIVVHATCC